MKKFWIIMLVLILCLSVLPYAVTAADGYVEINSVNFPDESFREYVTKLDEDGDGYLSVYERSIRAINFDPLYSSTGMISDATGIEYFTELEEVSLTDCYLKSLDVSMLTKLFRLNLARNKNIDLSQCSFPTSLIELNVTECEINELDLSGLTQLKELYCGVNNLSSLSLDGMTALTRLDLKRNNLTSIDLSDATSLLDLYVTSNQLTELSLENNPQLRDIDAANNLLTELDLSKLTKLDYAQFSGNLLEKVNLGDCITRWLWVDNNCLTSLDLDGYTQIDNLRVAGNTRRIVVGEDGEIDMSELGNVAKMSNFVGGTLSGNILTVGSGITTVTYDYDTGYNNTVMTVTLNIVWGKKHCVCAGSTDIGDHVAHNDIIFEPWFDNDSMPTVGGSYVLAGDVTLADTWEVNEDTVLCLCGQTLTGSGDAMVIFVNSGATLTICDCEEIQGKITGGKEGGIYAAGNLNLYGGEITDNGFTQPFGCGGGVYSVGTFNMYGGKIWNNTAENGGGVYQIGIFNMYGGHVCQNRSVNGPGGGVSNGGEFNLYGGTVHNNFGAEGGGIAVFEELNLYGGEIYLNTASICGGGIASKTMRTAGIVNLYGGKITNNTSPMGGGIYNAGELAVYGGTVTDNEITNLFFKEGVQASVDIKDESTKIGVTYGKDNTGVFGIGGKASLEYFYSDSDKYDIVVQGDDLAVVEHTHKWGEWKSNGDGTHSRVCDDYSTHTESVACSASDDANCATALLCECGYEITAATEHSLAVKGDKDGESHTLECTNEGCDHEEDEAHRFDQETATEEYLCSEASCTSPTSYYKSCRCGHKGTESFAVGEAAGHGETEIKDAKEATEDEAGYTGDTYCKTCGEKLAGGEELPKKQEAKPSTPATGDSHIISYLLIFVLSCAAAVIALLGKKKA